MRQHRTRHRHRAEQIDVELAANVGFARHLEMAELAMARIVDQHIDATERRDRTLDRARHRSGVGNVERG